MDGRSLLETASRRAGHLLLVLAAFCPWLVCLLLAYPVIGLLLLAHKVWPDADTGNCWTYAVPRWANEGGYIAIRPAGGVRLFRWLRVPHAIWLRNLGSDAELAQTHPTLRVMARFMPWHVVYFRFYVSAEEKRRDEN